MREELATEGFGVLTEIDVQATLERKLGVHGRAVHDPRRLQPARSPTAGLGIEPDLGVLLPCNVVVRDRRRRRPSVGDGAGRRDALAANPDLAPLAAEARERLTRALDRLSEVEAR